MKRIKKLSTEWFQDVRTPDQKKLLEQHLYNSNNFVALVKLKVLLNHKLNELSKRETNEKVFDNPNWSHLQAHYNGQRETIKWALDLLGFVEG